MLATATFLVLIACSIQSSSSNGCEIPNVSNFVIRSNTFTEIVDQNMNYIDQSTLCTFDNKIIKLNDSACIWKHKLNASVEETVIFRVKFNINGLPSLGYIEVSVNDVLSYLKINGIETDCKGADINTTKNCSIPSSSFNRGENTAIFSVKNTAGPGGLMFKISLVVNP